MNKKFIVLFSLVFTLIAGQTALACTTDAKNHCSCQTLINKNYKKYLKHLDLSTKQLAEIKELKTKYVNLLEKSHQQLKVVNKQLKMLAHAPQLEKAKLDALAKKKASIQANITKKRIEMHHQIYNLLNAKQKAALHAMIEKHYNDKK